MFLFTKLFSVFITQGSQLTKKQILNLKYGLHVSELHASQIHINQWKRERKARHAEDQLYYTYLLDIGREACELANAETGWIFMASHSMEEEKIQEEKKEKKKNVSNKNKNNLSVNNVLTVKRTLGEATRQIPYGASGGIAGIVAATQRSIVANADHGYVSLQDPTTVTASSPKKRKNINRKQNNKKTNTNKTSTQSNDGNKTNNDGNNDNGGKSGNGGNGGTGGTGGDFLMDNVNDPRDWVAVPILSAPSSSSSSSADIVKVDNVNNVNNLNTVKNEVEEIDTSVLNGRTVLGVIVCRYRPGGVMSPNDLDLLTRFGDYMSDKILKKNISLNTQEEKKEKQNNNVKRDTNTLLKQINRWKLRAADASNGYNRRLLASRRLAMLLLHWNNRSVLRCFCALRSYVPFNDSSVESLRKQLLDSQTKCKRLEKDMKTVHLQCEQLNTTIHSIELEKKQLNTAMNSIEVEKIATEQHQRQELQKSELAQLQFVAEAEKERQKNSQVIADLQLSHESIIKEKEQQIQQHVQTITENSSQLIQLKEEYSQNLKTLQTETFVREEKAIASAVEIAVADVLEWKTLSYFFSKWSYRIVRKMKRKLLLHKTNLKDKLVSDRNQTEGVRNRRILRVIQRMRSLRVSNAFNSWYHTLKTKRKLKQIAGRIMFKVLASSFDGWCSFVTTRQNVRKVMVRCVNNMTKTLLQSGFRTWLFFSMRCRRAVQQQKVRSKIEKMKF